MVTDPSKPLAPFSSREMALPIFIIRITLPHDCSGIEGDRFGPSVPSTILTVGISVQFLSFFCSRQKGPKASVKRAEKPSESQKEKTRRLRVEE